MNNLIIVYFVINIRYNTLVYVGLTRRWRERIIVHRNGVYPKDKYDIRVYKEFTDYDEARIEESILISKYKNILDNKINKAVIRSDGVVFANIYHAAESINSNKSGIPSAICKCCLGIRATAYKYGWRYK